MSIRIDQKKITDFEALHDAVQDAPVDIVQLEPGKMSGMLTHLSGPTLGISTGSFSRGVRQRGLLSDRRWSFGTLLDGPALLQDVESKPGDLVVLAPNEELYSCFPGANSYAVTLIAPSKLFAHLESQQPGAADAAVWRRPASVLVVDPVLAAARAEQFRTLLLALIGQEGWTMSAGTTEFFRREILRQITAPVLNGVAYRELRGRQSESQLVREVERYLIDAGARPVHLTELIETFNVHERRLYRAFDNVLGVPPITFQRNKRLGDVHAALLRGGPGLVLRDVAKEHGFLDYPRFAREYRRLFGEKPSHTVRRNRR